MADLIEAEIQVLASLFKAEDESLPTDKASLEKGGERFWMWQEDWSDAYGSLLEKGLIEGDDSSYRLTEDGRPIGRDYHHERPDRMWYYFQRLYEAVDVSPTFSRFCEQVFGKNLCQEGMADIDSIDDLIAKLGLSSRPMSAFTADGGFVPRLPTHPLRADATADPSFGRQLARNRISPRRIIAPRFSLLVGVIPATMGAGVGMWRMRDGRDDGIVCGSEHHLVR